MFVLLCSKKVSASGVASGKVYDPCLKTLFTVLLAQSIIRCLHLFLNWTAGSSRFVVDLSMYKPPGIAWAVPEMKTAFGVSLKVRSDQF